MKKLLLLTLLMVFTLIVGCIGADYNHKIYDPNTGKLSGELHISHNMLNVNEITGLLAMKFADGTTLILRNNTVKSDPNSAIAEADLVRAILSGGMFVR
jgi:hypothetical protein